MTMAKYEANNALGGTQQNVSSGYKTLLSLNASSATAVRRAKVYDVLIGTNGTPADNFIEWDISAMTAAGTGSAVTPTKLDPADAAALTVAVANYSAEPTVTANSSLFYIGVNQRASYRWVAAPGSELVIPAVNLAGLVLRAKSAGYTGTATGAMLFEEQ
jgi:hypothetical protein